MTNSYKTQQNGQAKGFSLVEVVVSVGIIALVAGIVVGGHSEFDNSVDLTNLAYEISLTVRQAQVYSTTVRESSQGSGDFSGGWGVHFDHNHPTWFVLFADEDGDREYDWNDGEERKTYTLSDGYTYFVCGIKTDDTEDCFSPENTDVETSVVYERPDAQAFFSVYNDNSYKGLNIYITSQDGSERKIVIRDSGLIAVE